MPDFIELLRYNSDPVQFPTRPTSRTAAQDSDLDGISDAAETLMFHTDINNADTDGDGTS